MSYEEALDRTDPKKSKTVAPGSAEEKAAIERFKDLFADWTQENVKERARHAYAENVYVNDTLKEINGIDALEVYLLRLFNSVESCTFDFVDVVVSSGDYYLRWVSEAKSKTFKKGQVFRSYGMSHIRFDETGKVVLHVDYWDSASGIFEHIPLLGGLIKLIKRRL